MSTGGSETVFVPIAIVILIKRGYRYKLNLTAGKERNCGKGISIHFGHRNIRNDLQLHLIRSLASARIAEFADRTYLLAAQSFDY
jgi:hypothetical protein